MEKKKWLGWLMSVLVASGGSGCASSEGGRTNRPPPTQQQDRPGPLLASACSGDDCKVDRSALAIPTHCPTGKCDPDSNGLGIYVAEQKNYCLNHAGRPAYCPEAFANGPGGVVLKGRYRSNSTKPVDIPVGVQWRSGPRSRKPPVPDPDALELLSIGSEGPELVIRYRTHDRKVFTAKGADLARLELTFPIDDPVTMGEFRPVDYFLRVDPAPRKATDPKDHRRYTVTYISTAPPKTLQHHCGDESVTFLGGRRVDGLWAAVNDDAEVTTMSCESGAISTCLAWGYSPWNPSTGQHDDIRNFIFGACLQAKRAAYFVGKGDNRSYTEAGTLIDKQDQLEISQQPLERLEAIWSPQGAVCLNVENLRRPEKRADVAAAANAHGVRPCTSLRWSKKGKLASGPARP